MSPGGLHARDDDDGDALLQDERSPAFTKGPGVSRRHSQESGPSRLVRGAQWPAAAPSGQLDRSPSPARSDLSGVEAFQDWGSSDDDGGVDANAQYDGMTIEGTGGAAASQSPRE